MAELTPMMKQYFEIKNQYGDYILMYRLGDFYEMFFDDAKLVSKELDLTLTGRDCGQEERAPMCGVPYHSAESYIGRLIAKGYKVAICEQTEDPAKAKGLVRREVVRIITPGTVMESSMLDERRNNFIGAVYADSLGCGVCFCDMSTGEVFATQAEGKEAGSQVLCELGRFAPSEVLLSDSAASDEPLNTFLWEKLGCHIEAAGEWRFRFENALEAMQKQFPESADALDQAPELRQLTCAVGGLLSYLHETQKNDLSHVNRLDIYSQGQFMGLDLTARRNLEITASLASGDKRGSLLWVLDRTKCAMGARLLRQWLEKPLLSVPAIQRRQNAVGALVSDAITRDRLQGYLSDMYDVERIIGRIVYGTANCRDLRALWQVCSLLPSVKETLLASPSKTLRDLAGQIGDLSDIADLIDAAIAENPPFSVREGGIIREGFSDDVDHLRSLLNGGTTRVSEIERTERERTGIKTLKVGYNKVFGYYIEISKSYISQAPESYIRKQTLTNCERYITQELKELEGEILSASERVTALEYELFTRIREQIAAQAGRVQQASHALACADVYASFAQAAAQYGYCRPEMDNSDRIDIRDGRHAVVERMLKDSLFVPNDTLLDCGENRVAIVTGPNMAGKSTYMRQVALIVIMAQCGSFVPAASATLGVCDRVFTRIGASDDLSSGRSTFMVEMSEVADILRHATSRSLLILDEIGRGTSTFDGMAIARAVLEYAADKKKLGAKTLFATHYHELCELEAGVSGVKNYNIVVKKRGDEIIFIKKIVRGGANDSYGIEVGKLAGLPDSVIRRAKEVLKSIERQTPQQPHVREPAAEEESQVSLGSYAGEELLERLKALQPDTLTPIEALGLLYELSARAKEC